MNKLTQDRLKEILSYDKGTGLFKWKISVGTAKKGSIAGNKRPVGYVAIKINSNPYYAHRLAWLYVNGEFPEDGIDHINGNKSDNTLSNLRSVSSTENLRNQKIRKNNKSGFNGVSWSKLISKWRSIIIIDKKQINLGSYSCIGEAIIARKIANIEYGFHENHGRK